ncbi:protein of unknown function [Candidatus Promineifilum breve]|uniref:Uncharacterized protein n=1 Tax=Candidatus Promineifilum breve TaxID=1806508 RepID=A0A160T3Z0_9CHLR|nr:protein of unknown function [Candidatus Promineifilum breve]
MGLLDKPGRGHTEFPIGLTCNQSHVDDIFRIVGINASEQGYFIGIVIDHFATMNRNVFPFVLGDYFFPLPLIGCLLFFHFFAVRANVKNRIKGLCHGVG